MKPQWRILGGGAPLRSKIFSISCSFGEDLAKSYVGDPPPPPRVGAPFYGESRFRPWTCFETKFSCSTFPIAIKRSKMLFRSKNRKNINNLSPSLEIAPLMENFDSGLDFPHR